MMSNNVDVNGNSDVTENNQFSKKRFCDFANVITIQSGNIAISQ